jgi:hypothetical protein
MNRHPSRIPLSIHVPTNIGRNISGVIACGLHASICYPSKSFKYSLEHGNTQTDISAESRQVQAAIAVTRHYDTSMYLATRWLGVAASRLCTVCTVRQHEMIIRRFDHD